MGLSLACAALVPIKISGLAIQGTGLNELNRVAGSRFLDGCIDGLERALIIRQDQFGETVVTIVSDDVVYIDFHPIKLGGKEGNDDQQRYWF